MKIYLLVLVSFALPVFAAEGDFTGNLRTNPLLWVIGPNLRIDTRIQDQLTLGASGIWYGKRIKGVNLNGTSGTFLISYNFNSALTTGAYLEGGAGFTQISAQAKDGMGNWYTRNLMGLTSRAMGGYQWFWGRFNLGVAIGADYNSQGGKDIEDGNGNKVVRIPIECWAFASEGTLGLAF